MAVIATLIATVALVFATVFVVCCGLLAAFIGSLLYMVVLNHRLRAKGLEREEELLATPLPPDSDLPHVVVQIPSFNEGPVLRRGVEAAAKLDWPRDKLHIQLLDDSTDETAELARTVAAELREKGFDVVALQRTDRSGFKGGALHEAMQQTPCRRSISCATACACSWRSRRRPSCRRASTSSIRTRTRSPRCRW
jgi:cellulose synthase/poly-beta-1,6-N-acetylglucosamine synthase-like glycosyltransferase